MTHADTIPRMGEPWPRLTETLSGPSEPYRCQSCGAIVSDDLIEPRSVWQEHDRHDAPEPRYMVLCRPCSDALIDPHPRLYSRLDRYQPAPGVMELCCGCKHRDGVSCRSPLARHNGGPGMEILYPEPTRVHVQRAGPNGRGRRCSWETIYSGPPTKCAGREPERAEAP